MRDLFFKFLATVNIKKSDWAIRMYLKTNYKKSNCKCINRLSQMEWHDLQPHLT